MLLALLASRGYAGGGMPWFVWPVMLVVVAVAVVASMVKSLGSAATGLAALKAVLGAGAALAARPTGPAQTLSGPIDLVGQSLAAGVMTNPVIIQVTMIIAAVHLCRQGGSNQVPKQYLTQPLAARWANAGVPMPAGIFQMLELHARPLPATPVGERMVVWIKGRINMHPVFTEYWTFVTSVPLASLPPVCPGCGAPTAGSVTTGICAYCHATIMPRPGTESGAPASWLVDDISSTPNAAAA